MLLIVQNIVMIAFRILILTWNVPVIMCLNYPESVRFGLFRGIFSRDGSLDFGGTFTLASMLMAVKDANKSPTMLQNTTLKFALRGTNHGEYRAAAKNSQDFLDVVFGGEGVNAVVGTGFFDSSKAASQVFSYVGINNVDFGANNTELSHADTYPFFRRVCPSDSFDGIILASMAKRHYGFNRCSIIYTLDTYGTDISSQFIAEAHEEGITIENDVSFWSGTTNFNDVISQLKSNGVGKVFVVMMKSVDAGRFLEAGYNAGLFPEGVQILGSQYVMMPTTWLSMSENAPVEDIMNGVIGVQPYVNRSNPLFQDFLRRYLKQSDTRILNSDGSITCNPAKDDDGNTPLFTQPPATGCGGVTFSNLKSDGSDLDDVVAYAYDAVMVLAHAVHIQLYIHKRFNYTEADISYTILNEVEFEGVTGFVTLFAGLGGTQGFGVGDRQSDLYYRILNFNANFYHKKAKNQNNSVRTIGLWTTSDGKKELPSYDTFIACNRDEDESCTRPVYRTSDNKPVDGSPRIVEIEMEKWARDYLKTGASFCFVTVFWYGLVMFLFWDTRLMKASQPSVMLVVLFGGCLGSIQVILKTLVVTDHVCLASMWVGHCAFAIIFLTLLFKTWRVAMIVNSGFTRIKFTTFHMYQILASFFLFFCVILVIDTFVGGPHRAYEDSFDGHQINRFVRCKTKNPGVTQFLFAMEGFILFYGAKVSYDAKDAPKTVNDSTSVSLSIYLIIFVCAVTFPIVFLSIDPTPQNLDLVMASGFIVAVLGVLNILFGYRTYLILDGADVDPNFNLVRADASRSSSKARLSNMAGRITDRLASKLPGSLNGGNDVDALVAASVQKAKESTGGQPLKEKPTKEQSKDGDVPETLSAKRRSERAVGKSLASVRECSEMRDEDKSNHDKELT